MYKLKKRTYPAYSETFATLDLLTEELSQRVCQDCKEEYGFNLVGMRYSECGDLYRIEVGVQHEVSDIEKTNIIWGVYYA